MVWFLLNQETKYELIIQNLKRTPPANSMQNTLRRGVFLKKSTIMAIFEQGKEIIVAFGTGDVTISAASPVKDGLNTELVFSNATAQRKIGEVCEEAIGVRTDELEGPVIRLQFNKLDSLRVVENMLLAVKRDMEAAMGDKKSRENER